jgi:hypothetical protein
MDEGDPRRAVMDELGASIKRSMAAQKGGRTRRANKDAEREQSRRTRLSVHGHPDSGLHCSAQVGKLYYPNSDLVTVEGFVAGLVTGFHDESGIDGEDLVFWLDGRLVAVVRKGEDGEPIATIF